MKAKLTLWLDLSVPANREMLAKFVADSGADADIEADAGGGEAENAELDLPPEPPEIPRRTSQRIDAKHPWNSPLATEWYRVWEHAKKPKPGSIIAHIQRVIGDGPVSGQHIVDSLANNDEILQGTGKPFPPAQVGTAIRALRREGRIEIESSTLSEPLTENARTFDGTLPMDEEPDAEAIVAGLWNHAKKFGQLATRDLLNKAALPSIRAVRDARPSDLAELRRLLEGVDWNAA